MWYSPMPGTMPGKYLYEIFILWINKWKVRGLHLECQKLFQPSVELYVYCPQTLHVAPRQGIMLWNRRDFLQVLGKLVLVSDRWKDKTLINCRPTHRFQVLSLHSKLSREWLHFIFRPSLSWSKHTFSGKVSYFLLPHHYALFMIFDFPPKYSFHLSQLSWHPWPIITHLNFISLTLPGPL